MVFAALLGISLLLTVALLPFFLLLAAITAAAFVRTRKRATQATVPPGHARFFFVIPAHDEQGSIGATVASCRAVDYDPARYLVFVIADNCTDATAQEAREAGARVLERNDPENRSKGHALEYFFQQMPEARPGGGYDAAVVIDADTLVDAQILNVFGASLGDGAEWLQCYYSVSNPDVSWRTRMLTYAFSLFNGVWPLGLDVLGLSVALRGNGMCFAINGLGRVPWRAYGLTEDLEFSWTLRLRGERVRFLPSTHVLAEMVSRGRTAGSQRRRWEAGRKALRDKFLRPLLASRQLRWPTRLALAIDLLFPPLSTLVLALLAATGMNLLALRGGPIFLLNPLLLAVQAAMLLVLGGYAVSPVLLMGLPARYLASVLALPYYMIWKMVVMAGGRPKDWVRTRRELRPSQSGAVPSGEPLPSPELEDRAQ